MHFLFILLTGHAPAHFKTIMNRDGVSKHDPCHTVSFFSLTGHGKGIKELLLRHMISDYALSTMIKILKKYAICSCSPPVLIYLKHNYLFTSIYIKLYQTLSPTIFAKSIFVYISIIVIHVHTKKSGTEKENTNYDIVEILRF